MGDLRDDLAAAVKDFRRVWPEPHPLSANLALAVRAMAELDVLAGREAAAVAVGGDFIAERWAHHRTAAHLADAEADRDAAVAAVARVRDMVTSHEGETIPRGEVLAALYVDDRPMTEADERAGRAAARALDGAGDEPRPVVTIPPVGAFPGEPGYPAEPIGDEPRPDHGCETCEGTGEVHHEAQHGGVPAVTLPCPDCIPAEPIGDEPPTEPRCGSNCRKPDWCEGCAERYHGEPSR